MSVDADGLFGGVEGGATGSRLVIVDAAGRQLASSEGPGSNMYVVGVDAVADVLHKLVADAFDGANMQSRPLEQLSMALAGAEDDCMNGKLLSALGDRQPQLANGYHLVTDAVGTLEASLPDGGVALVAGTGSSCRLLNPDGGVFGCGGWAHMVGDQGSATWIALEAVRAVFNDDDGLFPAHPNNVALVRRMMHEYFGTKSLTDMLDHLYGKFDKPFFAGFTRSIVKGAEDGDGMCLRLFHEAGRLLALHVTAVCRHAHESVLAPSVPVLTVGSVWNSFEHMRDGFVAGLAEGLARPTTDATARKLRIDSVKLYRPSGAPAMLMAMHALRHCGGDEEVLHKADPELVCHLQL